MAIISFKSASNINVPLSFTENKIEYKWTNSPSGWKPNPALQRITLPPFNKDAVRGQTFASERYFTTYTVADDLKDIFIDGLLKMPQISMIDEEGQEMSKAKGVKMVYVRDISADMGRKVRRYKEVLKAMLYIDNMYEAEESMKPFYDLAWMLDLSPINKTPDELYTIYADIALNKPNRINKLIVDTKTIVDILIKKGKHIYMDSISEYMVTEDKLTGRVKLFDNLNTTFVNMGKLVETLLVDDERRENFMRKVSELEQPAMVKFANQANSKKEKPVIASKKAEESMDTMDVTQLKLLWKETLAEARSEKSDRVGIIKRLHAILDKHLQLNPLQDMINVNKHYDEVMMEVFSSARYANKKMDWMFEEIFAQYLTK